MVQKMQRIPKSKLSFTGHDLEVLLFNYGSAAGVFIASGWRRLLSAASLSSAPYPRL